MNHDKKIKQNKQTETNKAMFSRHHQIVVHVNSQYVRQNTQDLCKLSPDRT